MHKPKLRLQFIVTLVAMSMMSAMCSGPNGRAPLSPSEMDYMTAEEPSGQLNTEEYDRVYENPFKSPLDDPLSTFSIDVDNASYSNVRRFLMEMGQLPPKDAVRIEEMINYFNYDYPTPKDQHPFAIQTEVMSCPWNEENKLVHIALKGRSIDLKELKGSNYTFLIDVSGSMGSPKKLGLVKTSLKMLVKSLKKEDRLAIVVYAGAAGLVLDSTPVENEKAILQAIDQLEAGGSTAGGAGIELAYKVAKKNFIDGGNNRIILATDGDFNIGTSSSDDLVRLIEEKRDDGIYLTICGYGMGNYKDSRMEQLSNAGNGNYFYIDNIKESRKVFLSDLTANMFTIAKDVKIQIEFNPKHVKAYRLIGYENRVMNKEDFNDDKKDAGELGAGHTVTALYEIIPTGSKSNIKSVDGLKYQSSTLTQNARSNELMTAKLRYKAPDANESILIERLVENRVKPFESTSTDQQFAVAVTGFGMLLRDSEYKGNLTYNEIVATAKKNMGSDKFGYRQEFINMVETAELLQEQQ
ncbi:MAG: VWA domain-containing protein [Bacteroidota bacterium]